MVKLVDDMIGEVIHYTLNMFRSDQINIEAERQREKLEELREYRKILVEAAQQHCSEDDLLKIEQGQDNAELESELKEQEYNLKLGGVIDPAEREQ